MVDSILCIGCMYRDSCKCQFRGRVSDYVKSCTYRLLCTYLNTEFVPSVGLCTAQYQDDPRDCAFQIHLNRGLDASSSPCLLSPSIATLSPQVVLDPAATSPAMSKRHHRRRQKTSVVSPFLSSWKRRVKAGTTRSSWPRSSVRSLTFSLTLSVCAHDERDEAGESRGVLSQRALLLASSLRLHPWRAGVRRRGSELWRCGSTSAGARLIPSVSTHGERVSTGGGGEPWRPT